MNASSARKGFSAYEFQTDTHLKSGVKSCFISANYHLVTDNTKTNYMGWLAQDIYTEILSSYSSSSSFIQLTVMKTHGHEDTVPYRKKKKKNTVVEAGIVLEVVPRHDLTLVIPPVL